MYGWVHVPAHDDLSPVRLNAPCVTAVFCLPGIDICMVGGRGAEKPIRCCNCCTLRACPMNGKTLWPLAQNLQQRAQADSLPQHPCSTHCFLYLRQLRQTLECQSLRRNTQSCFRRPAAAPQTHLLQGGRLRESQSPTGHVLYCQVCLLGALVHRLLRSTLPSLLLL